MTHRSQVEGIELAPLEISETLFDAVCEECGTVARFDATGKQRTLEERFETHCYNCNSGRFPGLGDTTSYRVVDVNPDTDSDFNNPVYSTDDSV